MKIKNILISGFIDSSSCGLLKRLGFLGKR